MTIVVAALVAVTSSASLGMEEKLLQKLREILADGQNEEQPEQAARYIPSSDSMIVQATSIKFQVIRTTGESSDATYQVKYRERGSNTWTAYNSPDVYNVAFRNEGIVIINNLQPGTDYEIAEYFNGALRGRVRKVHTESAARFRHEVTFYED